MNAYRIETVVQQAKAGDVAALDRLMRHCQDKVHRLSLRMLADPQAAQDATQEILVRIVTKISTFRAEAAFDTWVYRVAMNYLLSARKIAERDPGLSFDAFSADLMEGLSDDNAASAEDQVLLNQVRIGCTMAMLLCLDPKHRAAYVLGEVLEFSQTEACDVLEVEAATYRKRLARARADVTEFTAQQCGLANAKAACRCRRRVSAALTLGRVQKGHDPFPDAPGFDDVRAQAERAQAELVAAKLQRATGALSAPRALAEHVMQIVSVHDPAPPG